MPSATAPRTAPEATKRSAPECGEVEAAAATGDGVVRLLEEADSEVTLEDEETRVELAAEEEELVVLELESEDGTAVVEVVHEDVVVVVVAVDVVQAGLVVVVVVVVVVLDQAGEDHADEVVGAAAGEDHVLLGAAEVGAGGL